MQTILIEKPYQFIPPHRGNWWPSIARRWGLVDRYLRKKDGVVAAEVRGAERLSASVAAGHGVLLTPNHCRPADPLAMVHLARSAECQFYFMASWHLFNQDWLTARAIRLMGGFSVNREGVDRRSIDEAIRILTSVERPLIIFPEGGVTRTNDRLMALLDGVGFVARTAAKRRARQTPSGKVVVHPVAIKYLFQGDLEDTLDPILTEIEHRLTWPPFTKRPLIDRVRQIGMALLTLKEIQHFDQPQDGPLAERLQGLVDQLLCPLEKEWLGDTRSEDGGSAESGSAGVIPRIKALRMKIMPAMTRGEVSDDERQRRWQQLADIYLSQQVASYPPDYLAASPSVDRVLETVERFEEDLTDAVRVHGNLKVVIQVGAPIEVSPTRDRSAKVDPLMGRIEHDLQAMLDGLATESRALSLESTI